MNYKGLSADIKSKIEKRANGVDSGWDETKESGPENWAAFVFKQQR